MGLLQQGRCLPPDREDYAAAGMEPGRSERQPHSAFHLHVSLRRYYRLHRDALLDGALLQQGPQGRLGLSPVDRGVLHRRLLYLDRRSAWNLPGHGIHREWRRHRRGRSYGTDGHRGWALLHHLALFCAHLRVDPALGDGLHACSGRLLDDSPGHKDQLVIYRGCHPVVCNAGNDPVQLQRCVWSHRVSPLIRFPLAS